MNSQLQQPHEIQVTKEMKIIDDAFSAAVDAEVKLSFIQSDMKQVSKELKHMNKFAARRLNDNCIFDLSKISDKLQELIKKIDKAGYVK